MTLIWFVVTAVVAYLLLTLSLSLLGPMILFWMNLYYRGMPDRVSPARLASSVKCPVMLVHGENDRRFPVEFARVLRRSFSSGQATLFIAPGAGHSDSSSSPGYRQAVQAFLDSHRLNDLETGFSRHQIRRRVGYGTH